MLFYRILLLRDTLRADINQHKNPISLFIPVIKDLCGRKTVEKLHTDNLI